MIKKDTIVSTTDGRLTLLQWLKKVEAALKNASATAVKGVPQADGKVVFEIDFADGTSIESEPFELPEKLPEGYAVDEAGNVTLNGSLLIDKLGNVEMGKNAVVDGTLTLNTPENLVFKTGAISSEPEGYAVDGAGNVTIAGALKANNNGDVQVNKDLVVDGNTLHLAGDLVRIKSYIQNSYLHFRVELKDRNFADDIDGKRSGKPLLKSPIPAHRNNQVRQPKHRRFGVYGDEFEQHKSNFFPKPSHRLWKSQARVLRRGEKRL